MKRLCPFCGQTVPKEAVLCPACKALQGQSQELDQVIDEAFEEASFGEAFDAFEVEPEFETWDEESEELEAELSAVETEVDRDEVLLAGTLQSIDDELRARDLARARQASEGIVDRALPMRRAWFTFFCLLPVLFVTLWILGLTMWSYFEPSNQIRRAIHDHKLELAVDLFERSGLKPGDPKLIQLTRQEAEHLLLEFSNKRISYSKTKESLKTLEKFGVAEQLNLPILLERLDQLNQEAKDFDEAQLAFERKDYRSALRAYSKIGRQSALYSKAQQGLKETKVAFLAKLAEEAKRQGQRGLYEQAYRQLKEVAELFVGDEAYDKLLLNIGEQVRSEAKEKLMASAQDLMNQRQYDVALRQLQLNKDLQEDPEIKALIAQAKALDATEKQRVIQEAQGYLGQGAFAQALTTLKNSSYANDPLLKREHETILQLWRDKITEQVKKLMADEKHQEALKFLDEQTKAHARELNLYSLRDSIETAEKKFLEEKKEREERERGKQETIPMDKVYLATIHSPNGLNFRKEPNSNAPVIRALSHLTRVKVHGTNNKEQDWYYVEVDGQKGWVRSRSDSGESFVRFDIHN